MAEFTGGGELTEIDYVASKGTGSVLSLENSESNEQIIAAEIHDNQLHIRKTFNDDTTPTDTLYEFNTNGRQVIAKKVGDKIFIQLTDDAIIGNTGDIATIPYSIKTGDTIYTIAKKHGITNSDGKPDIDLIKETNPWLEENERIHDNHIEINPEEIIDLPIYINSQDAASWSITQINDATALTPSNQILWNSVTANKASNFEYNGETWDGGLNNGTSILEELNQDGTKTIYFQMPTQDLSGQNTTLTNFINGFKTTNHASNNKITRMDNNHNQIPKNYYEGQSENVSSKFITFLTFVASGISFYALLRYFSSNSKRKQAADRINKKLNKQTQTKNIVASDNPSIKGGRSDIESKGGSDTRSDDGKNSTTSSSGGDSSDLDLEKSAPPTSDGSNTIAGIVTINSDAVNQV